MKIDEGQSPEAIRRHNLGVIVSTIRRNRGIPRNRLARLAHLTKAAVSDMVQELQDAGFVRTIGQGSSSPRGGRKPLMLEIAADSAVAVGVDIRRERVSALMLDLNARCIARETRIFDDRDSREDLLERIAECIRNVLLKRPAGARFLGIGVGAPGPLDILKGRVLNPPDFGSFHDIDLVSWIDETFKARSFLSLGSAAGAMGEYCFRRNREEVHNVIVFVEVDLGIGFGMIVNGSVIQGNGSRAAGEIGHMVVQMDGRPCDCGRRGCLYEYASGVAVLREIRANQGGTDPQADGPAGAANNGRMLLAAVNEALAGNEERLRVFRQATRYLAVGLRNIDNLLSPGLMVVGSSIEGLSRLYLDHMMRWMEDEADPGGKDLVRRLQPASYGLDAISMGAAHTVLESFFTDPKKHLQD